MSANRFTLDDRPARRLDARIRNLGGVVVVAGPQEALELSELALVIWQSLDGATRLGDLARDIAAQYDEDPVVVGADVLEVVAALAHARVIR